MNYFKYISIVLLCSVATILQAQNLNYFFIDGIYQRSYINPALNDKGTVSLATGLGFDISTNGPNVGDFLIDGTNGKKVISAAAAIESMDATNDIFGYSTVNTLDMSFNTPIVRLSVGHAWKASGWMEYTKDLASFVTFGNGDAVGQTLQLAPQIEFLNYNEIYLGIQRDFGPLKIGAKIKRLNGVENISTGNHQIDLETSDDIYQLTLTTDYELRSSSAFSYTDIDDFDMNVENFSFDNFLSNNGGWAFDLGAAFVIGDRLELSASLLDVGSITWDVDPKIYTSNGISTFEGIDIGETITNDEELVITDSIEVLLNLVETNGTYTTTLPSQLYLSGKYKISDLWTVGAIIQSVGTGDRSTGALGLNATANVYKWLSVGGVYVARDGSPANIGLSLTMRLGPVAGFLSTDNILATSGSNIKSSNLRAGLSVRI